MNDELKKPQFYHWLSIDELRAIQRLLEKQYISYEDEDGRAVLNRIETIIRLNNDLVNKTG